MKRFVTTALVAVTVGVVLANVAGAQSPIKDMGNSKRSLSPFEDVATKLAPKRSQSPFEDVAKPQRPVKNIGKVRTVYIQCAANGLNLDANPRKAGEVYLWGPNGGSPQQWRLKDAGDGLYYIQSASNGLFLTSAELRNVYLEEDLLAVLPHDDVAKRVANSQKWRLTDVPGEKGSLGSGLHYIQNKY